MKKAFTMIELVFVIVVIGILAATILPSTKTNPLQEAAVQLVSHIRYTQHLAMVDDKFDMNDPNWYKKRWQLVFSTGEFTGNGQAYTIFSDTAGGSTGNAQESEIARNPQNREQIMTGGYGNTAAINYNSNDFKGMKKLNIGKSYGVTSVTLSGAGAGACSNSRIVFDHLGRLIKGDISGNTSAYESDNLVRVPCDVKLKNTTESVTLRIEPETGYVSIL